MKPNEEFVLPIMDLETGNVRIGYDVGSKNSHIVYFRTGDTTDTFVCVAMSESMARNVIVPALNRAGRIPAGHGSPTVPARDH